MVKFDRFYNSHRLLPSMEFVSVGLAASLPGRRKGWINSCFVGVFDGGGKSVKRNYKFGTSWSVQLVTAIWLRLN